ncbi:MAG: parallel beta-helix repeat-containing protein [Candidatus Magnetoglobus multicellularis str. Araruama]|uniref:Parallel beta-helix repeat-containing protein n=1 Tax=Candidatus Magnetoglobus multicellularis str. Araruama TaxID=890399 RepID=A0A1V1PHI3_9BACT|nr:MAG: parallel beta-helix repeat-containing protein [Candidatus Magnetoglobus multicellularis str. Araruama]
MSVCGASIIQVPSDYANIQDALNAASEGDTVKVSPGVYYENIKWPSTDGIQLLGTGEDTVIDGGQAGHVIELSKNFIGTISNKTLISNFTITNGKHFDGRGGGIYCKNTNPCLSNLVIEGNYANSTGGGFFAIDSNPELSNSVIKGNYANSTLHGGAGISIMYSNLKLKNVVIQENTSARHGGGIYSTDSELNATNILIVKNFSKDSGGGIYSLDSTINLANATIHSNSTNANQGVNAGGTILISSNSSIVNSIIWDNSDYDIIFYCSSEGYSLKVEYSNIKGGKKAIGLVTDYSMNKVKWLDGNLITNPSFVDPESDDYHLSKDSQCIDAGHPDYDSDGITWENDVDDQDEIGTRMDMGYMYPAPEVILHSISGRTTSNGVGVSSVEISFLNQKVITNNEGQFTIHNIPQNSEGKVTALKKGYNFIPTYIF